MFNRLFTEEVSLLDFVSPQSAGAGTLTTGWIDLKSVGSLAALIALGAMSGGSTVAAKLEQSLTSAGSSVKDVTGKAITQLVQTPTDHSNTASWINCRADELDVANGYEWVRLSITTASAASLQFGAVFGANHKFMPASDHDSTKVNEQIS